MPGVPELLIILLIVVLIFGAGKLPQIGGALGKSIKNFKRSMKSSGEVEVEEKSRVSAKERNELDGAEPRDADLSP